MSIPDSHAVMFTRIPDGILKQWTTVSKGCSDGSLATASKYKHASALISNVAISVEFNRDRMFDRECLSEHDDAHDGKIAIWQEARRNWDALETAISDAIAVINQSLISAAAENEMRTVEVLQKVATTPTFIPKPQLSSREYRDYGSRKSTDSSQVRTLHTNSTITPADSVSRVSGSYMRKMLGSITEEGRHHKHNSKTPKLETVRRRRTA